MSKLLLLSAHPTLPTPQRLVHEARLRGWDPRLLHPSENPSHDVASGALLLTRAGTFQWRSVLRQMRCWTALGAEPLQRRRSVQIALDQWRTLEVLRRQGVPVPSTALVRSPREVSAALDRIPGPPYFVKGRLGSKGSHVRYAETDREAREHLAFLWGQGGSPLLQTDLRATGPVHRVLIAGGEPIATVEARPADGEVRSNIDRGGSFVPRDSNGPIASVAHAAARAVGLPYLAVDLIGWDPVVLEVNASPGLEGIEQATSRNLAGAILDRILPSH